MPTKEGLSAQEESKIFDQLSVRQWTPANPKTPEETAAVNVRSMLGVRYGSLNVYVERKDYDGSPYVQIELQPLDTHGFSINSNGKLVPNPLFEEDSLERTALAKWIARAIWVLAEKPAVKPGSKETEWTMRANAYPSSRIHDNPELEKIKVEADGLPMGPQQFMCSTAHLYIPDPKNRVIDRLAGLSPQKIEAEGNAIAAEMQNESTVHAVARLGEDAPKAIAAAPALR